MRPRDLHALELDRVRQRLSELARSSGGKEACARIAPSPDRALVEAELDKVAAARRVVDRAGEIPLGEFPDVTGSLRQASHAGYILDGHALLAVRHVLDSARASQLFLKKHAAEIEQLQAYPERLEWLPSLRHALMRALDDDGLVNDDASDELAEVRQRLRTLRAQLTRRLDGLLARPGMDDLLSDRYITLRNNRFVIPLKTSSLSQFDGIVQDRSVSGETTFVEPPFAVDLNNKLLISAKEEEAIVRRILADLTDLVRADSETLAATYQTLVELDVLQARVTFANQYRCTQPQLDTTEIELRGARHPALLFGNRAVTAIDLLMPSPKKILLITGPNTGGKTVGLKTLGLLALMVQSGIPIPVDDGSRMPCFAAIYADIGDAQSIERSLSTFSSHLANIAEILELGVDRALVLLDEPGVGTEPEEGAALGIGIIRYLQDAGAYSAATTHYTALKVFALSDDAAVCAAVDFDVATMQPRYRLVYHTAGESLALPIARRMGLPNRLLTAAEGARSEQAKQLSTAMSELERARRHYEERAEQVEEQLRQARVDREETSRLVAEWREKKRQRWSDELDRARSFVRQLRDQGREALANIERGEADRRAFGRLVREQETAIAGKQRDIEERPESPAERPKVGDQVEVMGSEIRGQLMAVEGERAWIQRGSLRFEVPAAPLRKIGAASATPPQRVSVQLAERAEPGSQDISLIGMRVKEALSKLEDFLDHAVQQGLPSVRIIHGVGSGALRRAVGEYLSDCPYCVSARPGEPAEGGAGVTVAQLSG